MSEENKVNERVSIPGIDQLIDMSEVPDNAKPYFESAILLSGAGTVMAPVNRALSDSYHAQAYSLYNIVCIMSGKGPLPNKGIPNNGVTKDGCGSGTCGTKRGAENAVSEEVSAEIDDLVKDIESMISGSSNG